LKVIKIQNGIPETVIKEVLRRTDIVETVGKYVHLMKQGKHMIGLCPFHSEKTPSFSVTPEKQIFYCYGCGQGGDVIKFVCEHEGYSFPEAVKMLAQDAGIPITWDAAEQQADTPFQRDKRSLLTAHELSAKLYHYLLNNTEFGSSAKDYLRSRGMTDKLIDHFMIGYAPDRWDTLTHFLEKREFDLEKMEKGGLLLAKQDGSGYVDRFRGRIMFPLWDREGKVIGFAGRLMGEGQPKYLNSPETILFHKSKSLYHLHHARQEIKKTGRLVLLEGYMDVIKAWDAGVRNGVATMGTSLTEEHVELIRRMAQEVIICYDGDKAGQAAALKTVPMLEKARLKVLVAQLPQGSDPDDYIADKGPEAFVREVIGQPVSPLKFKLIYSRKSHTMVEEEGRKNYVMEAVRLIAQHESAIEREFYLKELSLEFDISLDTLKQNCHQVREQMQKNKGTADNNVISWNNGMNEKRRSAGPPPVLPAYQKAERHLLQAMLQDADIAGMVHDQLGEAFVVEDHAALAAYLYAYYAQGHEPDASRFIASLQDDRLERATASILMMDDMPYDEHLLKDYIKVIRKEHKLRIIEQRREEWAQAERSGDHLLAAQIVTEIIALERQVNEGLEDRF